LKKIIYVPGKNPKPPADQHREQLLRCLLHGVTGISPGIAREIEATDSFSLVAWNSRFYETERDIGQITPWVDRLLGQDTFPESDIEAVRTVKYRFARSLYQVGDLLPWIIPLLPDERIKSSIRDTELYFNNHGDIACRVRDIQKQPLREAAGRADKVLLIGHSMGSVIAYDSLWELHHLENIEHCVDCLLTIGSPLGMNYVQRRLIGLRDKQVPDYPGNIRTWVNISSRGDLVALDRSLANDFREMMEQNHIERITDRRSGIYNHYRDEKGLNVHKSYGYLANPVVAETIAEWWRTA
jgi:hypothetical protein